MAPLPPGAQLPTFENLGVAPLDAQKVDADKIAKHWVSEFGAAVAKKDIPGILSTLYEKPWWRDIFALTWDLRTFFGQDKIEQFLKDRFPESNFSKISYVDAQYQQPWSDVAWICTQFEFETEVATGRGIVRLVPTSQGWKALIVATNIEGLKGFPELIGPLRNFAPSHGKWVDQRKQEQEFAESDPEVLIVGGGQSGLDIGVRLKLLGTSNLIVEKNKRVGDQWRNRYEALCLHDPVCKSSRSLTVTITSTYDAVLRVRSHALPQVCFMYSGSWL